MYIYFLFTVQSLQCYFCQSAVSIEDCSSRQLKITCPSHLEEPLCAEVKIKAITNGGKETYVYTRGKVLLLNKQWRENILHWSILEPDKNFQWTYFRNNLLFNGINSPLTKNLKFSIDWIADLSPNLAFYGQTWWFFCSKKDFLRKHGTLYGLLVCFSFFGLFSATIMQLQLIPVVVIWRNDIAQFIKL